MRIVCVQAARESQEVDNGAGGIMIETLGEPYVKTIEVNMPNRMGFQLRMAVRFVQGMQKFRSTIQVRKGEILADGKNILELLTLEAGWHSKLEIEVVGDDAGQTIESIKEFFLNKKNTNGHHL
jgi:phosphotransferase system HPr (HPr) family protein